MKQNQMVLDLNRLQNDMFISQNVLNTGKEINRASDDSAAARRIMLLENSKARREQYLENINDGQARIGYADSQLQAANDILVQVRTVAIEGSNSATTDIDRRALSEKVDNLLHELVSIANSRHEEQYIFGGFNTQTPPYEIITDPATGETIEVRDLEGLDNGVDLGVSMEGGIFRKTSDGEEVKINVNGTDVFQTGEPGEDGDIFQVLIDLRDALADGVENDDEQVDALPKDIVTGETIFPVEGDPLYHPELYQSHDTISNSINRIDQTMDLIGNQLTTLGGTYQRMENSESKHEDISLIESEHLSEIQDADITEWLSKFQLQSIALEQAMNVSSRVLNANLVNFIR
jgi:flagellar hook-associated protein 3 FlgL